MSEIDRERKKIYNKRYRNKNKDKIRDYNREYYEQNKEIRQKQRRDYYHEVEKNRITITKNDLKKAFDVIGDQRRFFRPGRFLICKEVYKDDNDVDDSNSAVEYDCFTYQQEGIDALFEELKSRRE